MGCPVISTLYISFIESLEQALAELCKLRSASLSYTGATYYTLFTKPRNKLSQSGKELNEGETRLESSSAKLSRTKLPWKI